MLHFDTPVLIALAVVHAVALGDVWTSRLSRNAKVLWSCVLIFLFGVGLFSWLLTRHSAHSEVPPVPASE